MSKLLLASFLALFTVQAFAYGTCRPRDLEAKNEFSVVVDGDMAIGFYLSVYRNNLKKPIFRELTTLGGNKDYSIYEAYRKTNNISVAYIILGSTDDSGSLFVVDKKLRSRFTEEELEFLSDLDCK